MISSPRPKLAGYSRDLARLELLVLRFEEDAAERKGLFAVLYLQQVFRRTQALRKRAIYPGLSFFVEGIFKECLQEVDNIRWSRRRYRLIFLGPLPHALACLDALKMQFEVMKAAAAKRLMDAPHHDLEKRGKEVVAIQYALFDIELVGPLIDDDCSELLETARDLRQNKLGPKADTYRLGRWPEFMQWVRQIRELMDKLPTTVGPEIAQEWEIVAKGILKRGKNELGWVF